MQPRKLRILHVGKFYPPHRGGMETHLELICQGLRSSSEVSVLVANRTSRTTTVDVQGVHITRVATFGQVAGTAICPAMVTAIRRHPADVVHLHWPNPTAVLAYLASGHAGRLVITYHSDVIRQRLLEKVFRPFLERVLARASAVIVTSPSYIDGSPVLRRIRNKCRVVPLGLRLNSFDNVDRSEVDKIRSEFGPRLVLSVGRHVYYKGFEYLIAAMQQVEGRALIVGDGPLRCQLEALAVKLGVQKRVVFLGEVENITPYCHAADVFVLPSIARSEAFGIVQLEAMACGRPVINTAIDSGVPFVSLDGITGLTVRPGDANELAGALNLLLDNPILRANFGRAGRNRVEKEFSVHAMTSRTLQIYNQVTHEDFDGRGVDPAVEHEEVLSHRVYRR
jgi:glycosyltransferase involved in cell wall biosynthesis